MVRAICRAQIMKNIRVVEYARALGERYGFSIRCTPSCGAMANVASTSIRLNTDGPEITFTLLGHGGKKDLFLSEEEALTRAKVLGCPGTTHKHGSRHHAVRKS